MPACAVISDKGPGLSCDAKSNIRQFLRDRKMIQVPTEYSQFKATKCTVIVAEAFSERLQKELKAGIKTLIFLTVGRL